MPSPTYLDMLRPTQAAHLVHYAWEPALGASYGSQFANGFFQYGCLLSNQP
jgi:hypothetical protein